MFLSGAGSSIPFWLSACFFSTLKILLHCLSSLYVFSSLDRYSIDSSRRLTEKAKTSFKVRRVGWQGGRGNRAVRKVDGR